MSVCLLVCRNALGEEFTEQSGIVAHQLLAGHAIHVTYSGG